VHALHDFHISSSGNYCFQEWLVVFADPDFISAPEYRQFGLPDPAAATSPREHCSDRSKSMRSRSDAPGNNHTWRAIAEQMLHRGFIASSGKLLNPWSGLDRSARFPTGKRKLLLLCTKSRRPDFKDGKPCQAQ
jgi:hypothetical protein